MYKSSEFYYGLPQDQWDNLILEAEDLLRDEQLGNHLVGIYPAGNRIFGLESEPPGILCLYVDSVDALINPSYKEKILFDEYHIGNSLSPIFMIDLFYWAKWLIHWPYTHWNLTQNFIHAIPFGKDVIYQDDSISEILDAAKKLMITRGFGIVNSNSLGNYFAAAHLRANMILSNTNKLSTCINSEWSDVYDISTLSINIPNYILELDNKFIHLSGPRLNEKELQELKYFYSESKAPFYKNNGILEANILGEKIAYLYRSLA